MSDVDYEFREYCRKHEYSRKKYAAWKRLRDNESIDAEQILNEARLHFRDPAARVIINQNGYYDESWLDIAVEYMEEEKSFIDRMDVLFSKTKREKEARIRRKLEKVQARQALENEYGPYIK